MNPEEQELLEAMGNCYVTCEEGFEETLRMISGWRGYTTKEVVEILAEVRRKHGSEQEYLRLRARFPKEFPV